MMTIKIKLALVVFCAVLLPIKTVQTNDDKAKALIEDMVKKVGTYKYLKSLKDVEYTYTFYSPKSKKSDVSTERYIFDGEISWASYKEHNVYVMPEQKGDVIQWYDGKKTYAKLDSLPITDEKELSDADFLRKTNYYWFTMMPKLLDEGLTYSLLEDRVDNGITYKMVKIGFNEGVGDVQDEYVLYINPKTKLVDKFIFTVKDLNAKAVLLLEIDYDTVNNYTFMAHKKICHSDWDGNKKGPVFYEQTVSDVKFNNGFTKEKLLN